MSRRFLKVVLFVMPVLVLCGLAFVVIGWPSRGIPFVGGESVWSVGIYEGTSPFDLVPARGVTNPVLTAADVTDVPAQFVADPFLVREGGAYWMFIEVLNRTTDQGDIAVAASADGRHWTYDGIVLDEPFHLSYPHVFAWEGAYYMIPESGEDHAIRLYRATRFPHAWEHVDTLLDGAAFLDPTLFRFDGRWWLFASIETDDNLHLYLADELTGPWTEHPDSPVVSGNADIARPAGRVIEMDGSIFRFSQDCDPTYGNQVRAFRITKLTPSAYGEEAVKDEPVIAASGSGWNAEGMHQVDAMPLAGKGWLVAVDGLWVRTLFGLQY